MKFKDFEDVISADRMRRYVNACGGNVQKGMTLYRYNLSLSGELLKIIGCFEVALRNRIDRTLEPHLGNDWLRDSPASLIGIRGSLGGIGRIFVISREHPVFGLRLFPSIRYVMPGLTGHLKTLSHAAVSKSRPYRSAPAIFARRRRNTPSFCSRLLS